MFLTFAVKLTDLPAATVFLAGVEDSDTSGGATPLEIHRPPGPLISELRSVHPGPVPSGSVAQPPVMAPGPVATPVSPGGKRFPGYTVEFSVE